MTAEYQKAWRAANLDWANSYQRSWRKAHPIQMKEYNRVNHEKQYSKVRALVFRRYGKKCAYCGSTTRLELDHIFPLVRTNGHNVASAISEWIGALVFPKKYFQILCKSCNLKKGGYYNER